MPVMNIGCSDCSLVVAGGGACGGQIFAESDTTTHACAQIQNPSPKDL